jgi:small subunit ribosomal protein S17
VKASGFGFEAFEQEQVKVMAEKVATLTQAERLARKTIIGLVTSAQKTPKTIRVEVHYLTKHPKYGKFVRKAARMHAHDEKSEARVGDRVQIMECRPISKTKNWRLVKVLERAPQD